jgi:hypothetical protein
MRALVVIGFVASVSMAIQTNKVGQTTPEGLSSTPSIIKNKLT